MRKLALFTLAIATSVCAQWDGSASPRRLRLNLWADTMMGGAVDVAHCDDSRIFIVKRNGVIRIVSDSGTVFSTPFLSITGIVNSGPGEQGLLGMAFDPDYANNGFFYLNYIGYPAPGITHIARYQVSADPNVALPGSGHIIYSWPQPYTNHNGGDLDFGPDGNLWFPLGDGGGSGDPDNNAQDLSDPLGDMVRIHPESDSTYSIPADNPYVNANNDTLPEIWASGFRNPYRFGFDRLTGDIWIGDVGQGAGEEVNFIPAGSPGGWNFGWRCREGFVPYNTVGCQPGSFYDPPIQVHPNTPWCAIIGGRVYRGNEIPWLYGRYVYTDYCLGQLHTLEPDGLGGFAHDSLLADGFFGLTFIAEDSAGELYTADKNNGLLFRIEDACPFDPPTVVQNGALLESSPGSEWQWYLNDTMITGANGQNVEPLVSGSYHVVVLFDSACALASGPLNFVVTNMIDRVQPLIMIHPSPASDQMSLRWRGMDQVAEVQLWDATGRILRRVAVVGEEDAAIECGELAAGQVTIALRDAYGAVLAAKRAMIAH